MVNIWDAVPKGLKDFLKNVTGDTVKSAVPGLPRITNTPPLGASTPISIYNNLKPKVPAKKSNGPSAQRTFDLTHTGKPVLPKYIAAAKDAPKAAPNAAPIDNGAFEAPVDTGPSAYDIYEKMVSQFNPDQMAKDQFAPQFAMLDKLNKDAKARYSTNDKTMGDMYGALQRSIQGDAAGISKNYDAAAADTAANYAKTNAETTSRQNANKDTTAAMLQSLGIQAAAPALAKTMDDSSNMWDELRASGNQRATNLNTQNKASSLDYNNSMKERAGFEGAAQRTDLMQGLTDFINGNETKRFGVTSDQSNASSGYKLKQMDMYKGLADTEASSIGAAADTAASAYKAAQAQANSDRTYDLAKRSAARSDEAAASKNMTAYDKLAAATKATGIWGETDTAGMTKLIADAYGKANLDPNKSKDMNGQQFVQSILASNPGLQSQPALRKLATQYFNDSYSGK